MKRIVLIISFLSCLFELEASFSSSRPSLTAAQIAESRARQAAVIAAEPKRLEIGTVDVLLSQVNQVFTYQDNLYKGIGLRDFSAAHQDLIDTFTQCAITDSSLPGFTVNRLYSVFQQKPGKRDITLKSSTTEEKTRYKVVGIMPSSTDFQDDLFYIGQARDQVLSMVHSYIDRNHSAVRRVCTGLGLPETISKDVWSPGCCDVQLHKSCFKQCRHNMITSCINPFCQKTDENKYCRSAWSSEFYDATISRNPIVPKEQVRDSECKICFEPLSPAGGVVVAATNVLSNRHFNKKRKIKK